MALWCEAALVGGRWLDGVRITHDKGLIVSVETSPPEPDDERAGIAAPGLGNVHCHAFQRGMAGLAETRGQSADPASADSFWTWREVMYRFLDRLDPPDVEAIAALAYAEMLESGFTRVGEFHYLHHARKGGTYDNPAEMCERIAAAAAATGIGLTLLPVFYAHGGFGGEPPAEGQKRFLNTLDSYAALLDGARRATSALGDAVVGVAPHSLRAATPEQIERVATLAGAAPVPIHIAAQAREVDECRARHGAPPVRWLLDRVSVDDRWCLVHATHVSNGELSAIASAGAVVGLCPITEANLGDGVFPAAAFLSGGGRIGIGSDSNVLIDAAEELRTLEYGQRLQYRTRNVLASSRRPSVGFRLFDATLVGGAQALGVKPSGLLPGEALDLVSLDPSHPSLVGRKGEAWVDGWIFAGRAGMVDGVWRRGRKVVSHGRHVAKDAIVARYRQVLAKVLAA